MKLKLFTAFTGVGSPEMSLKNIGVDFELVGMSEVDRYALIGYDAIHNNNEFVESVTKEEMIDEFKRKNIAYNFSTGKSEIPRGEKDIRKLYESHIRNKNFGDIRNIEATDLPKFDMFTYSFPCKNISISGNQCGLEEGSETQSSLLWECRRIIKHSKPKFLLMENVKNLVGKNHKGNFDIWCSELEELGYNNYWKVLNGKNFGVAQNRERVMMVSIRGDIEGEYSLPSESTCNTTRSIVDILEDNVDEKFYMNKPFKMTDKFKNINMITGEIMEVAKTNSNFDQNARVYGVNGVAPTISARDYKDAKKILVVANILTKGKKCNKSISSPLGISPTLTAMIGGNSEPKIIQTLNGRDIYSVDGFCIRKLTPLECWRLQGFSDADYYKAKNSGLSNSKLYERAGRGIVVPMLEEIFKGFLQDYIK